MHRVEGIDDAADGLPLGDEHARTRQPLYPCPSPPFGFNQDNGAGHGMAESKRKRITSSPATPAKYAMARNCHMPAM